MLIDLGILDQLLYCSLLTNMVTPMESINYKPGLLEEHRFPIQAIAVKVATVVIYDVRRS